MRFHWDPFGSCVTLPSTGTSSDVDSKFDVETVSDEGTLVETRQCPSHPDKADSISLSDVPEDEKCIKSQCTPRGSPTCSENLFLSAGQPIIYPLPSDEGLLADKPPPAITVNASVALPSCVHALTPPPTHYKRRRARIISDEDNEPEPDQTPVRCVCVISILAVRQVLITPETDPVPRPRAHCDSCSEPQLTPDSLGLEDGPRIIEHPNPGFMVTPCRTHFFCAKKGDCEQRATSYKNRSESVRRHEMHQQTRCERLDRAGSLVLYVTKMRSQGFPSAKQRTLIDDIPGSPEITAMLCKLGSETI